MQHVLEPLEARRLLSAAVPAIATPIDDGGAYLIAGPVLFVWGTDSADDFVFQVANNNPSGMTAASHEILFAEFPTRPQMVIVFAGDGDDLVYGYDGVDDPHFFLFGEGGADVLRGGNASDHLFGGDGVDDLAGSGGNDFLYGGEGDDGLFGEAGNDVLSGGGGSDVLEGGVDDDILLGGSGDDSLKGEDGRDVLVGGPGFDSLIP